MKLKIFSVRDSALQAFVRPFFVPTTGVAIRGFTDEVNRVGSEMNIHPGDYELFAIGEFDEESAVLASWSPVAVVTAKSVLVPKE